MKKLLHLRWFHLRVLSTLAGIAVFNLPVLASLGGDVDSVGADRAHMNASIAVTANSNYNIHEMQSPEGTVVDEYVNSSGTVFAVSWHGHFVPDMQQLMGTYFNQYSAALQSEEKHYGHRPLNIKQTGLVVETGGHMRLYSGRAYIPSMLPEGFSPDQMQ